MLEAMQLDDDSPPAMVPLSDGTVQLEWHYGDSSVEIVVGANDDPVEAWTNDGDITWTIETTVDAEQAATVVRAIAAR